MTKRPLKLPSTTYRQKTPVGTAFIRLGFLNGEPFEVFIDVGKGGSQAYAFAKALECLATFVLQLDELPAPRERLRLIANQLAGIGSSDPIGLGPKRVASLPDGVAKVLDEYLTSPQTPSP